MGKSNKSLELTPEVLFGSVTMSPMNGGRCAVVGGAAQLYVRTPRNAPEQHL